MPMRDDSADSTPSASDWDALFDLQREHAAEIRVIKTGYTHIVQQMAEITVTLHAQDKRIEDNARQLADIGTALDTNTRMTQAGNSMLADVRDAVTTTTTLWRVAKFLGAAVLGVCALWLALRDALKL